jgi:GAG-pre-integrase domain
MAGTMGDSGGQTWEEWHKAMGHISPQTLKSMRDSGTVQGMKVIPSPLDFDCSVCIQGKHAVHPLPKESTTQYTDIGELIVTDIWGLAQVTGHGRFQYYISFTDAATRFSAITFLKEKSDALEAYQQYKSHLKTQYNQKIKCVRFDSGKEFLNDKMIWHLHNQGTLYNTTTHTHLPKMEFQND